jgi:hypothetical protein
MTLRPDVRKPGCCFLDIEGSRPKPLRRGFDRQTPVMDYFQIIILVYTQNA